MPNLQHSLIDVEDSLLILIDIQEHFLAKLPPERAERLVNRVSWVMEVAKILHVPIVATAEEPQRWKGLADPLASRLSARTMVFNKLTFDLAAQTDILAAVRATGRRIAVLVGLETDVCVAQSALGLLGQGFEVVALLDATDSPDEGHAIGLKRMQTAGVLVTSIKDLYYEWVRTVEGNRAVEEELRERLGASQEVSL